MPQMCPNCSFNNPDEGRSCSQCLTPLRYLLGENVVLSQRYKVTSVLGCGAMGAVYLADDVRLKGRRCAIKENRPDDAAPVNVQNQSRDQFLAEASVLARLDHPNLPKVSDYFIENDREYLVMDYVEGEDLESRMHRTQGPLDEPSVLNWADQVLDALQYLHGQQPQPIIHRDIKPANLRVDLYNRVKLVDFGLVKLFDADSPETKTSLRGVGTPAYAPLEQFAGSGEHTDTRSDIYSFGATLYHLLTNQPPVEVHQRLLKHKTLAPPSQINAQLSKNTEQVMLKALSIYPNERYQTALEMRAALANKGTVPLNQLQKSDKSGAAISPWIFGAVGLLIVFIILGGLTFAIFQDNTTPTAQSATPAPSSPTAASVAAITATASPSSSPMPTASATLVGPATESAGEFIANTPTPIVVTATPSPSPTPTSTAPVAAQPQGIPAASLEGTIAYPVFNGASYDLYFGQADGSSTRLFRANASQPAFNPTGSRIALHSWSRENRGLMTMDVSGANAFLVATFVEDQLPTWSADSTEITLLSRRSGSRKSELIRVSSLENRGQSRVIGEGEYPTIGPENQLVFKGWGNSGFGLRQGSYTLDELEPITDSEQDTAPVLSPNGSQIAFMSQRDGNWEVYVINADGSNLQRLTDNPARDGLPTWSPDGRVLAFVSDRGEQWAIWATTPTGQTKQLLFEIQGSPDGFVGNDTYASRGWAEERISWTR